MKRFLVVLLIVLMFSALAYSAENITGKRTLQKPTVQRDEIWMDANRMNGVMYNQGVWFYDYTTGDWGLEWPKGSGLSPIFAGGQWVSAKVGDEVRVAGVIHSATEFQAGEILSPGVPANPKDGKYKWYVIQPGGVGDWTNWPVDQGAPVDENGKPLLLGDKTAYSIWNDLGDHALFGTNKLGLEVRQLAWAYNRADAMGDMVFIKWTLINKSGVNLDSTYFSIWLDPDNGDGWDDFVGCDPDLGLGYCYNSTNDDQIYGAAPPAVGIDFFQGPIVDNPDSTVTLPDGTVLPGKEMLKMTSFIYYNNDDSPQGNPQTAGDVWNYQRGYWRDGARITDPQGNPSAFMFSGDPEQGTGWLDDNAADRRFLMTTGPFAMKAWVDENGNGLADFGEPGVQEIVAGVIVARGADNLNSVTTLKTVDGLAQLAYDLNFNLANAPLPPKVEKSELPNEIILTWDDYSEYNEEGWPYYYSSADPIVGQAYGDTVIMNNVITVIDDSTYNFFGYSVYQYSDASQSDPVLLAHWDNGGSKDPAPYAGPHFIRVTQNKNPVVGNVGDPLINGKEYYFGVVAEGYLEFGAPTILPSPPTVVTVVPRYTPGVRVHASYSDTLPGVTHEVTDTSAYPADANVYVRVVDPASITGHDYEIFFDQQQYFRDENGKWQPVVPKRKGFGKPGDVTGSTLTGTAVWAEQPGTVDLYYLFDLVSSTGAWVDGIKITFPPEVSINSADPAISNYTGEEIGFVIENNTIFWGNNDTTEFGKFIGGEVLHVNVDAFTLPLITDYIIYDDGYGSGGNPINAVGQDTITTIEYEYRTENHWNLKDVTANTIVLEDRLEVYGPDELGDSAPIADGLQIIIKGSYEAPVDFIGVGANEWGDVQGTYDIDSYGYNHWAATARAIDAYGEGSTDLNELTQDYEIRFTGEYADSLVFIDGADTIVFHPIKEGTGSIATFYGARNYDIANHPLNPNPGSSDPFAIRIPFEVWNVTTGQQVNIIIYDRIQTLPSGSTVHMYAFNPNDRMYTFILNTPYVSSAADLSDPDVTSHLTWNHVWWTTDWVKGDVIHFKYANPIQLGVDKFTFTTGSYEVTSSSQTLKTDLDKINVVPNPYYGYHSGEMDAFDRWVQFTFLPAKCTIRIFDLAGNMIRKLEKNDPTTPFLRWDLKNEYELPVASGIYIYHVDVPDIGTKVGKMAIFTPNERLDTY